MTQQEAQDKISISSISIKKKEAKNLKDEKCSGITVIINFHVIREHTKFDSKLCFSYHKIRKGPRCWSLWKENEEKGDH